MRVARWNSRIAVSCWKQRDSIGGESGIRTFALSLDSASYTVSSAMAAVRARAAVAPCPPLPAGSGPQARAVATRTAWLWGASTCCFKPRKKFRRRRSWSSTSTAPCLLIYRADDREWSGAADGRPRDGTAAPTTSRSWPLQQRERAASALRLVGAALTSGSSRGDIGGGNHSRQIDGEHTSSSGQTSRIQPALI